MAARRALELSISLTSWSDEPVMPTSWHVMRELARQAEAIGVDAIFVADQSGFDLPDGLRMEFWDGWTLLPALAEATSRVAIGPLVSTPLFRHPVVLARMACTLDEISGGRVILGLGTAGSIERAVRVLNLPAQRLYSRFEETVGMIAPLLRNGTVDFHGQYFQAQDAIRGPAGPHDGGIPIWIGARGPKMMRLAARWADAINFQPALSSADQAQSLLSQFEDACREVGRDPVTVEKTGWAMLSFAGPGKTAWEFSVGGDTESIAAQMHAVAEAGTTHLSCYVETGDDAESKRTYPVITAHALERLAPVIMALRDLEAAG